MLSLCQSTEANELLAKICKDEDIEFKSINKNANPKFEISDEINDVDLIIGIGRSAYDAMACGIHCILFDKRPYNGSLGDGYLYPSKFLSFAKYNCSGRFSKRSFSRRDLANEIKKYNANHGVELCAIAKEELNLKHVSSNLIEIGIDKSGWKHKKHWLKILLNYFSFKTQFGTVKRSFRAKMKKEYQLGMSTKEIKAAIDKEKFILPLRLSLYLYWLQLKKHN